MAGLAIRLEDNSHQDDQTKRAASGPEGDVKIIWKGKKIAKVVFSSGKEVVFEEQGN